MCLGDVAQVVALAADGTTADVVTDDRDAVRSVPLLALEEPVEVGAWIVVHLGVAVAVLDEEAARLARDTTAAMRASEVQ